MGDVMIDTYLWGSSTRMSPEAPVPVVDVDRVEHRLGGAANVALNLASLGAKPMLLAVCGDDAEAKILNDLLDAHQLTHRHLIRDKERHTTVKTRVMSQYQQVLRFDRETRVDITALDEIQLIQAVEHHLANKQVDVLVFQDYNKGTLTPRLIADVTALCNQHGVPMAVDPKALNFFAYKNVDLFKPNLKEVREALGMDIDKYSIEQLFAAAEALLDKLNCQLAMITLSEAGVFIANRHVSQSFEAVKRDIMDVSGAGDTVISVAALALAQQLDMGLIAQLANIAGGMVCEMPGVSTINKAQFQAECERLLA